MGIKGLVCRVARILAHIQEFSSRVPGQSRSGIPRGLFWPENEELSFRNLQDNGQSQDDFYWTVGVVLGVRER